MIGVVVRQLAVEAAVEAGGTDLVDLTQHQVGVEAAQAAVGVDRDLLSLHLLLLRLLLLPLRPSLHRKVLGEQEHGEPHLRPQRPRPRPLLRLRLLRPLRPRTTKKTARMVSK